MADNKKPSDNLLDSQEVTDFLSEQDPQSAVAAQGMAQLGAKAMELPQVQQALDFGGNLDNYNELLQAAMNGDPEAQKILADHSAGIAMGTVATAPSEAKVFNSPKIAKGWKAQAVEKGPGQQITFSHVEHDPVTVLKNPENGAFEVRQGGTIAGLRGKKGVFDSSKDALNHAMDYIDSLNKGKVLGKTITDVPEFAKGGEVKSLYFTPPQEPVAALPVSADSGLKQQLSSGNTSEMGLSLDSPEIGSYLSEGEPSEQPSSLDSPETNEFVKEEIKKEKFGTPGQQAITALEGAGRGLVGPLAPLAEKAIGVDPEDILARSEVNPKAHFAGEAAGLVGPALLTGGAGVLANAAKFTQIGALEAVGKKLGLEAAGTTLASKVGTAAARGAIDNMLISGSDEVSKLILNDPNQSAETAVSNVGLSALLGAGLGGSATALAPLWKVKVGDKVEKLIEDFKGRVNDHINNPEPTAAVTDELQKYYTGVKDLSDEVYGAKGLKAQDIAKAMPEMSQGITDQSSELADKLTKSVEKMKSNEGSFPPRLASKLEEDLNAYTSKIKEAQTPAEIFNAGQDLKQNLQNYAKFDKFVKPVDEAYDFVRLSKDLSHDVRNALEDKTVWGKAAERQQAINSAFKDYLPTLKDFEKKFTSELNGERVIDPAKVNTYMNQLGKPNAEIKQQMLKNFLDSSDKYKKVIDQTHINLGIDSPIEHSPLNNVMDTFKEQTAGSKLADFFVKKGLSEGAGQALGAGAGSILGHATGIPYGGTIGALVGAHSLSPFFNSVLPGIAKSLIGNKASAEGIKAAVDYGYAVVKGESLLNKATKNLFKASSAILPEYSRPSEKDRTKLDKQLKQLQVNPSLLMQRDNKLNVTMPNHGMALDSTAANALNYLNSLRTNVDKQSPLDSEPTPSSTEVAKFNRALDLAEQPLLILDSIKEGTITQQDITHIGNLYPSLYNRIKDKLLAQVVDTTTKKEPIPYKTRVGLSMFLAQPLDSTMKPEAIMSAQLSQNNQQNQQQSDNSAPKSSSGMPSAPALQKLPGMYKTALESLSSNKSK